jgi:hypothetical protein
MHNSIVRQIQLHQRDKANGVKHTPLHTLQECCEAAGIDYRWFGRIAAKHADAPQPVLEHAKTRWKSGKKYYRKHEFVQWVNKVFKQKEKAMPDIKTALEKALSQTANAWAADDEAHQKIQPKQEKTLTQATAPQDGRITNNVSRATFEYVRAHPGTTLKDATDALVAQGYKAKSVSALIYQMITVRLIVADPNGKLTTVLQEYVPIKANPNRVRRKAKAQAQPERKKVVLISKRTGEVFNPKQSAGIAALPTKAAPKVEAAPQINSSWDAETLLNHLSIKQARALYDELRKIFGG